MTVLEGSNELYKWFSENDSFCLEKDFIKIISITETPERDRATMLCALENFEKSELVSSSQIDDKRYWVIEKPFHSYAQSVSISPELALTLAGIINNFCEIVDNETDYCDTANIEEKDIKNLIYIANIMLAEKNTEKHD